MRVFRPSVGKRLVGLMPDSPAVSSAQFSAWPAPNEVTTPRPVTTTTDRPDLSLPVAIFLSLSQYVRPARDLRPANAQHPLLRLVSSFRTSAVPNRSHH